MSHFPQSALIPRLSAHFMVPYMNHVKCIFPPQEETRLTLNAAITIRKTHERLLQMDAFELLHFDKSRRLLLKKLQTLTFHLARSTHGSEETFEVILQIICSECFFFFSR